MAYSPSLKNATISLDVSNTSKYVEGLCDISLYPGMVLGITVQGHFLPNVGPGSAVVPLFAVENGYSGGSMFQQYLAGVVPDRVMARIFRKGDRILTKVNSTMVIEYGAVLTADAGGWLKAIAAGEHPLAFVDEEDASPVFPRWTRVRIA